MQKTCCPFIFAKLARFVDILVGPCHDIAPPTLLLSFPLTFPINKSISIGSCLYIPTHTFIIRFISPTPLILSKHPYFQPYSHIARESCPGPGRVAVATGNITDIAPADFANPWNFFYLFQQRDE